MSKLRWTSLQRVCSFQYIYKSVFFLKGVWCLCQRWQKVVRQFTGLVMYPDSKMFFGQKGTEVHQQTDTNHRLFSLCILEQSMINELQDSSYQHLSSSNSSTTIFANYTTSENLWRAFSCTDLLTWQICLVAAITRRIIGRNMFSPSSQPVAAEKHPGWSAHFQLHVAHVNSICCHTGSIQTPTAGS